VAAHTGIEPNAATSRIRVIPVESGGNQRVLSANLQNLLNCSLAQNYAVLVSEFVRKRLGVSEQLRARRNGNSGKLRHPKMFDNFAKKNTLPQKSRTQPTN
jgi:hypothetical protein